MNLLIIEFDVYAKLKLCNAHFLGKNVESNLKKEKKYIILCMVISCLDKSEKKIVLHLYLFLN